MKKILLYILYVICACSGYLHAQPAIVNIDPVNGYPGSVVAITGSGFGTNPANIAVWFGSAEGEVVSVADNVIEASVPAGAYADNIMVTDLTSRLSVQSSEKFYPVFHGDNFDPALLQAPVVISDPAQVYDPCTCDLDGDGLPEVISTKFDNATNLLILQNQSTPEGLSFSTTTVSVGQPTVNIRCGDLNGDGKPDLYMSRGGSTRFNIFVLPNNSTPGAIAFGAMQTLPMDTDVTSRRVMHGDLNGDGKPEIVVSNSAAGQVIVFENTSTGSISFNTTPVVVNVQGASTTTGLDVQDMDGDGRPDIVTAQFLGNDVFVLRNTGEGTITFADAVVLPLAGNSLLNLTTGDFNADGTLDIAVVGNASDKVIVFGNNSSPGNLSFASSQSFSVNDGPWGITSGDVDGDGLLDMIVTSVNSNMMTVLNNESSSGSLAFTKKDVDVGNRSRNAWVADLDGDAKPDFAVATQNQDANAFDVRLIRNKNCYSPVFLNEQPVAICSGQTVTLEVPEAPAAIFTWTKDGSTVAGATNTLDITAFGTYEVTAVTEAGACSNSVAITVADGSGTIPDAPTAGNDGPACIGGSLTLTVNTVDGATYHWTGPNNFTSTEQNPVITDVTTNTAGIYKVRIQSGDCLSSESSTTVSVVSLPEFTVSASGATTLCEGSSVVLSTQNRDGYTYQWYKDGAAISGATSSQITASESGSYQVLVDHTGSNCEIETNAIEVNVYTMPAAAYSMPASACSGQEVAFTSSTTVDGTAPVEYSWDFGDGTTSTELNPVHTFATAGNYTVQHSVTYTGVTGCSDQVSKGITVTDATVPVIQAVSENICPGSELELSVEGDFTAVTWNTSETTASILIGEEGTYAVTTTDANGCESSAEIFIGTNPVPDVQVSAEKDVIFSGEDVQLEATGAETYVWTPAETLDDPNISNPLATPQQTTTYTVTGTNTEGCSDAAEITITVNEGREIDITPLKAFSPLSTINQTWTIENVENYPDCTMSIFDDRGALVYRQKGYNNDWDATYKGGELPEGVYYYVFGCENLEPKTGSVLVVR